MTIDPRHFALFRAAVAAVDKAVAEGHPRPGVRLGPGQRGSIAVAAASFGVSASTFRHRYRRAIEAGIRADSPLPVAAKADPEVSEEVRTREQKLADENARLRKELRDARRAAIDEDAVLRIIGRIAEHDPAPPAWLTAAPKRKRAERLPEVPVAMWADWHLGETVNPDEVSGANRFDLAVARKRVDRLVERTIDICRHHHGEVSFPGIVIPLMGDFISGGLHPELEKTDDLQQIPSALEAIDLLTGALSRMADEFGAVHCPAVPGNHGRNTLRPQFKEYIYTNFDWLIYQCVARRFEDRGDKRVSFQIPASGDALFRVHGLRFMATHGDMLGVRGGDGIIGALGPITRGEIKLRGQSQSLGRDYDVLLIGHWHQMLWGPRCIVANALKGFDEYAAKALRAVPSTPSQPLFFVHPKRGITSRWEVMLEDPVDRADSPWCEVPKAVAP